MMFQHLRVWRKGSILTSRNGGGRHRNDGSIVIGLMDDRESFVSQQTQRMAAAEARRRSRSGTSQDTFLTFNNSLDRQGRNDRVHGNEPLRPDPSVSAGGPGEAPMLDVAPAPKNWHWRRGSKEWTLPTSMVLMGVARYWSFSWEVNTFVVHSFIRLFILSHQCRRATSENKEQRERGVVGSSQSQQACVEHKR
jgi:hypothetical protein